MSLNSNEIEITLWKGPKQKIDPYTIHYVTPGLFESTLHFDNGTRIRIHEDEKALTKLIQEMERRNRP
jgi:hypothetical protein